MGDYDDMDERKRNYCRLACPMRRYMTSCSFFSSYGIVFSSYFHIPCVKYKSPTRRSFIDNICIELLLFSNNRQTISLICNESEQECKVFLINNERCPTIWCAWYIHHFEPFSNPYILSLYSNKQLVHIQHKIEQHEFWLRNSVEQVWWESQFFVRLTIIKIWS